MANVFWKTLSVGMLTGMRSMTPLATLSGSLAHKKSAALATSPLRFMQSGVAASGLKVLAAAEIVADKLPGMADRISPPALVGRGLSGALAGAMLYKAGKNRQMALGALLGSVAALAGTYGSFYFRKALGEKTDQPDTVWAVTEDAVVLTSSLAVAKAPKPGKLKLSRKQKRKLRKQAQWAE